MGVFGSFKKLRGPRAAAPQPAPRVELISVHVLKAAGASFRRALAEHYGPEAVFGDYAEFMEDPRSLCHLDPELAQRRAVGLVAGLPPRTTVIHGHFPADKYLLACPEAKRVIWLRHPVARLVSHYYFWLTSDRHGNLIHDHMLEHELDLPRFARLPVMRDFVSNNILKSMTIDDFDFVGLQERYPSDLARLATALGWPERPAARADNKGRLPGYAQRLARLASDDDLIKQLARLNQRDMELSGRLARSRNLPAPLNPFK